MGARRRLENLEHRLLLLSFSVLREGKWLSRTSTASWFIRLIVCPRECHMVLFLVHSNQIVRVCTPVTPNYRERNIVRLSCEHVACTR